MQYRSILKALGVVVLIIALGLVVPTAYAGIAASDDFLAFLYSTGLSAAVGAGLLLLPKTGKPLKNQDGFALVSFGWLAAGLFGSLPYLLSGAVPSFTDAYFESISGFTTTGASVFTVIEDKTAALLLWRSMTQWFGGMGIIVLTIAIIPYLDIGGMSIFQAEVPGPTAEKLTPRIQDTAKVLWLVYLLFTVVLTLLLWVSGLSLFDAVNHAFTTMSTGGFSTQNSSVAGFGNPLVEWIITLFMLLAGINFALHYRWMFQGFHRRIYLSDSELHFYLLVTLLAVGSITLAILVIQGGAFEPVLRGAAFTVASIITTTGFGTVDYELWPVFGQLLLLLLMVMGGCAGSTAGGAKAVRIMLVLKYMYVEMLKLLHPNLVRDVKMQEKVVDRSVLSSILGFLFIYITVMVFSILLVSFQTDFTTAIGSVVACLSNIGPGIGSVGPTENYAHLGDFTKWVLSLNMVLGRLEILTLLILFLPQSWGK